MGVEVRELGRSHNSKKSESTRDTEVPVLRLRTATIDRSRIRRGKSLFLACLMVLLFPTFVWAQRIQFAPNQPVPSVPFNYNAYQVPQGWLPQTPPTYPSAAGLGFDPNNPTLRPNTGSILPNANPNMNWGFPTSTPSTFGAPFQTNPVFPNTYPNSVYPNSTPNALFPGNAPSSNWGLGNGYNGSSGGSLFGDWFQRPWFQNGNSWNNPNAYGQPNPYLQGNPYAQGNAGWGNWGNGLGNGWFSNPNGALINGYNPQTMRFFLGPRVRHTWVASDNDPDALETNDTDVSLVFGVPNFLASTQPLYLIPSFSMHTFDGPRQAGSDLPGRAYSAFLDVGWESDPIRTFGLELGSRLGVFTNFDTFNSDSFRVMAKALARVRLTPNATLRGGVFYIDRNRYKVIPAGGILWIPNQDTRFDLFFPEPKLAHYLTTLGTQDLWWYITGYYGGGTWTIKRAAGTEDSIDINDFRIAVGLDIGRNDMLRQGRRLGFIEAGYAFHRELLYRLNPGDNLDLKDAFVLRAGFGY